MRKCCFQILVLKYTGDSGPAWSCGVAEERCFHGGVCFKSLSDILTESDTSKHGMAFILPLFASPLSPAYFPEHPPVKLMLFPSTRRRLPSSSFTMHISFSPTNWRTAYANIEQPGSLPPLFFSSLGEGWTAASSLLPQPAHRPSQQQRRHRRLPLPLDAAPVSLSFSSAASERAANNAGNMTLAV